METGVIGNWRKALWWVTMGGVCGEKRKLTKFHTPASEIGAMACPNLHGVEGSFSCRGEEQLVIYLMWMCDMGYGLTPSTLKMKVYEIMKTRWASLNNNVIPGVGWMRWWKLWHPEFTIHSSQGLEFARARGLSVENVKAFCNNLASLYDLHQCLPTRIWNYK